MTQQETDAWAWRDERVQGTRRSLLSTTPASLMQKSTGRAPFSDSAPVGVHGTRDLSVVAKRVVRTARPHAGGLGSRTPSSEDVSAGGVAAVPLLELLVR